MENKEPRRILLIDGLNNFLRSFVVVGIVNDNGEFFGGVFGTLQTVKHLAEIFSPHLILWCWEGRNSAKKRRELFEDYKAGRKVRTSLSRVYEFNSPEEEKANLRSQLLKVKEYFSYLPIYQLEIENFEADDVIAYVANNLFKDDEKIIISSDKDYWQLVNDKVKVFRPIKKELIDKEHVLKTSGVSPNNFAVFKSIIGDQSDGIPKLKRGLGEKTAVKLFPFLSEDNIYTIDDILKFAEQNKDKKGYDAFLNEDSRRLLERNYSLVQLSKHDIGLQSVDRIKSTLLTQNPSLSMSQLTILFLKDQLHSQIKRYDDWNRIFIKLNYSKLQKEMDIL